MTEQALAGGRTIFLPMSKALEISLRSLKIRFGRSLITTSGIILAIAFLMSVWSQNEIISSLRQANKSEINLELQKNGVETLTAEGAAVSEEAQARLDEESSKQTWLISLSLLVCGVGIAAPFELWNWRDLVGAPAEDFAEWKSVDFRAEVARFTDLPAYVVNDATAACRAELIYGQGKHYRDYAYFILGAFIGGGIVMNHLVVEGQFGNAGSLGSLPLPGPDGQTVQLIDVASIRNLAARLVELVAGTDGAPDFFRVDHPGNR